MQTFLEIIRAFLDAAVRRELDHQIGCGVFDCISIVVIATGNIFPNPTGDRMTFLGFFGLISGMIMGFLGLVKSYRRIT